MMFTKSEHGLILESLVVTTYLIDLVPFYILTLLRPPASMFSVRRTNQERAESVIQDTREKNVKNVSCKKLACNDILYNLIKQFEFCFKWCPRIVQYL